MTLLKRTKRFDSGMEGQKGTGQISKGPFSEGKKIAPHNEIRIRVTEMGRNGAK